MGSLRFLVALCVILALAGCVRAQDPSSVESPPLQLQLDENGQDADGPVGTSTELLGDPWVNAAEPIATDQPDLVAEMAEAMPPVVANTVVRSSATTPCAARKGTCKAQNSGCSGVFQAGLCPGASSIQCCLSKAAASAPEPVATASCGPYQSASKSSIKGNANKIYTVVKIAREHMSDPSKHSLAPDVTDNTMTVATACAFNTLSKAARSAGHRITINCGFRTYGRQQYFWGCYRSKRCNSGSLAASPGTSPHGIGVALDLALVGGAYGWMAANAHKYGFIRTVPSETWHWEHHPGRHRAPYT